MTIETVRDAYEYLTGQWVAPARYTEQELDQMRRSDILVLARMRKNEEQETDR